MNFTELCKTIDEFTIRYDFQNASEALEDKIFSLQKNDFIPLVTEIGKLRPFVNTTFQSV